MATEILLRVTRDAGYRLCGHAKLTGDSASHEFSGMLELMRVFDDLIPPDRDDPIAPDPPSAGAAGD